MKRSLVFVARGFLNCLEGLEVKRFAESWAHQLKPDFIQKLSAEVQSGKPGPCTDEVEAYLSNLCAGKKPSAGYQAPLIVWDLVHSPELHGIK